MTYSKTFAAGALAALSLVACQSDTLAPTASDAGLSPVAPARALGVTPGQQIPGRYIVLLRPSVLGASAVASSMMGTAHGSVRQVYSSGVIHGFVADLADSAAAALSHDARVLLVEPDAVVTALAGGTQTAATWGLDRIDQTALPLSTTYTYGNDGSGVTVYVVDTGINYGHTDFGGRATPGYDAVTTGGGAVDCHGHGTHVSGTVGGAKYGVAKNVSIVGVRVLDCSGNGSNTGVIAGLNYVLQQKQANPSRPMVVNMSLGGGASTALDNAVASLTNAGVTVVVAAGNSTANACTQSPSRAPSAITVGATDKTDHFASFSNFGTCVDIDAPGVSISSDYIGSTTATASMSGTSMASPHVAGAAALYLAANPTATAAQVVAALTANATPNAIIGVPASTVNRLLNVSFLGGAAPVNQAPTAAITAPTNGASVVQGTSVSFAGTGTDPEDGALSGASLVWTSSRDGQIGTGASFATTTLSIGTHTITLTAKDSKGATGTATRMVTVTAPSSGNQAPVADFTYTCSTTVAHQCTVDASTSTDDVGVVSYTWQRAGSPEKATQTTPTRVMKYAAAGTYGLTLTVTDAGGLTGTVTKQIVVP